MTTPLRLAIYADPRSRVEFSTPESSAIIREFKRVFGSSLAVQLVSSQGVQSGAAFDTDPHIFILPGIIGEKSYYHDHIGASGNRNIRSFVEKGGLFMGFCAGAYYASSRIIYEADWGERKERTVNNLSFFNGVASGPVKGVCRATNTNPRNDAEEMFHVDAVPVLICDSAMQGRRINLAYGLGPIFSMAANPGDDVDVIARYADVEGTPPAVIDLKFGKGRVMLSGVLPQFGQESDPSASNTLTGPLARLLGTLYANRHERREFWNLLMHRAAGYQGYQLQAS